MSKCRETLLGVSKLCLYMPRNSLLALKTGSWHAQKVLVGLQNLSFYAEKVLAGTKSWVSACPISHGRASKLVFLFWESLCGHSKLGLGILRKSWHGFKTCLFMLRKSLRALKTGSRHTKKVLALLQNLPFYAKKLFAGTQNWVFTCSKSDGRASKLGFLCWESLCGH